MRAEIKQTHILISDYDLGDIPSLEYDLSVYDDAIYTVIPKGYRYDKDKRELRIPRGVPLGTLKKYLGELSFVSSPKNKPMKTLEMLSPPKNIVQVNSINFLTDNESKSQVSLNLDTGDGKTYCAVSAVSKFGKKVLIIAHADKIKKQWVSSFLKFTDISKDKIIDIDGSKTLIDLQDNPDKYDVYIVNHNTVHSFMRRYGNDALESLVKKLDIGVKIFDEAHLNFDSLISIDLYTDVSKTIYLTASLERSDHTENKLFSLYFKYVPKYSGIVKKTSQRHIIYLGYLFDSKASHIDNIDVMVYRGFSRNRYVDYQMKKDYLFDSLRDLINQFGDEKMLILSSKINSSNIIADFVSKEYPEKIVGVINSDISEEDKKLVYENCNVISSTPQSTGTGVDIPELRYCINTEPYKSQVTATQISGRLRPLGGNKKSFYVELVDVSFDIVEKLYKARLKLFKRRCFKVIQILKK